VFESVAVSKSFFVGSILQIGPKLFLITLLSHRFMLLQQDQMGPPEKDPNKEFNQND